MDKDANSLLNFKKKATAYLFDSGSRASPIFLVAVTYKGDVCFYDSRDDKTITVLPLLVPVNGPYYMWITFDREEEARA